MSKHSYEIEIKSLLGDKHNADRLKEKMREKDSAFLSIGSHKQLNHYFEGGDLKDLYKNAKDIVKPDEANKLKDLSEKAKDFSVRTRQADDKILLVVKASIDDTTSSNGIARLEFEARLDNFRLDELDELVLKSGFSYQAKWSREREEFKFQGANVSIDKNAGYGYLSEFEMVVEDENKADDIKLRLRNMMEDLGVKELQQDRLARMFDYYNKNWKDYYGTDKIFIVD